MKDRGFILVEVISALALYLGVVLGLVLLIGKNMNFISNLYFKEEEIRVVNNIRNIVKRDVIKNKEIISKLNYEINKKGGGYYLKTIFSEEESLGKIKNFSEINLENIEAEKKKLLMDDEEAGEIWILRFKIKNQEKMYLIRGS